MTYETRILEVRGGGLGVEQRSVGAVTLTGYAAVFDSPALITRDFQELVVRGAFADSIAKNDVQALYAHDGRALLGRTANRTLRLGEDHHGLRIELDVPETTLGRDVATLVERRDLVGMSIGFRVLAEDWNDAKDPPLRRLLKIDLWEVSIVPSPAYDATSIAVGPHRAAPNSAAERLRRRAYADLRRRGLLPA